MTKGTRGRLKAGLDLIMSRYSPSQSLYRRRLGQHWYELDLNSNRYQRKEAEADTGIETAMIVEPKFDLQSAVVRARTSPALLAPFMIASIKARRLAKHRMGVIFNVVSDYLQKAASYGEEDSPDQVFHRCAIYRRLGALRFQQPLCLEATLGALYFLQRPYPGLSFCIGIRADPFLAHAWLELDGVVLNDSLRRVEDYKEICVVK